MADLSDEKLRLLGLVSSGHSKSGTEVMPGERVMLTGRILRMHESGFCLIELEGDQPQPAILAHVSNLLELRDGK